MKNSSTTKKLPTDCKQTQISRKGYCDVDSNKICSDACVVVVTDTVLKNVGVSNSFNQILEVKKWEKKASGVTFANVTEHGKFKSTNFKSWIPKSTVFDVSPQVPSLEDFPPLAGVCTKKCVP